MSAKKNGRPSSKTPAILEEVCLRISKGESLRAICKDNHIPDLTTILRWRYEDESFYQQYARAREAQAELLADELFTISDDETKDITGELEMPNGVAVQRSRLKVDTRKWYLSKVLPKVYGDRVLNEHTGKDGGPLQIEFKSVVDE